MKAVERLKILSAGMATRDDFAGIFRKIDISTENFKKTPVNGETVKNIKQKLRGVVPQDQKRFMQLVDSLGLKSDWSVKENGLVIYE